MGIKIKSGFVTWLEDDKGRVLRHISETNPEELGALANEAFLSPETRQKCLPEPTPHLDLDITPQKPQTLEELEAMKEQHNSHSETPGV